MQGVYAVCSYRTDTAKEHDRVLQLYECREDAHKHRDNLNSLYERDPYCVLRARVEWMEVVASSNDRKNA